MKPAVYLAEVLLVYNFSFVTNNEYVVTGLAANQQTEHLFSFRTASIVW